MPWVAALTSLDLPHLQHPARPALADRRLGHLRLSPDAGKSLEASKTPIKVQRRAVDHVCRFSPDVARAWRTRSAVNFCPDRLIEGIHAGDELSAVVRSVDPSYFNPRFYRPSDLDAFPGALCRDVDIVPDDCLPPGAA